MSTLPCLREERAWVTSSESFSGQNSTVEKPCPVDTSPLRVGHHLPKPPERNSIAREDDAETRDVTCAAFYSASPKLEYGRRSRVW